MILSIEAFMPNIPQKKLGFTRLRFLGTICPLLDQEDDSVFRLLNSGPESFSVPGSVATAAKVANSRSPPPIVENDFCVLGGFGRMGKSLVGGVDVCLG